MSDEKPPGARPGFRYLALAVAVFCVVAAAVYGWTAADWPVGVALFLSMVHHGRDRRHWFLAR
jgi:hypothetical protein